MGRLVRAVALVGLALLAAGCGDELAEGDDDGPASEAEPDPGDDGDVAPGRDLEVVTSVFALASLADEIAPGAQVELLGAGGQDPHDLELSPGDRRAIEDADVVLFMGDIGYQPQVEDAVDAASGEVVAVTGVVDAGELRDVDHAHDDHAHDDHAHDDDGPGDTDPHVWLSPALMADVAEAIGETFAAVDAGHAEAHRTAAASARDDLVDAEAEIDERLAGCEHTTALVGHEAWAYLLEPRDLAQEGISGAGGHGEASPQRLAELADLIAEAGIPGVFAEPLEGRQDAEALAAEADVELYEVDPLETPADARAWRQRGYLDLLADQVATFAEGLRCRT